MCSLHVASSARARQSAGKRAFSGADGVWAREEEEEEEAAWFRIATPCILQRTNSKENTFYRDVSLGTEGIVVWHRQSCGKSPKLRLITCFKSIK